MNFDATYIFILKYKNKHWYYFNSKSKKKELMLFLLQNAKIKTIGVITLAH